MNNEQYLGVIPFSENSVTLRIGQTPFAPTSTFPCVALILEIGIKPEA